MDIVSMSTPCSPDMTGSCAQATKIHRVQRLQVVCVVRKKGIPLLSYSLPEKSPLSTLCLKSVSALQFTSPSQAHVLYDLVWHSGSFFFDTNCSRPNWSGYMQHITVPPHDFWL